MTSRYIGRVRLARQVNNELTFRWGTNHRPSLDAKLIPVGGGANRNYSFWRHRLMIRVSKFVQSMFYAIVSDISVCLFVFVF